MEGDDPHLLLAALREPLYLGCDGRHAGQSRGNSRRRSGDGALRTGSFRLFTRPAAGGWQRGGWRPPAFTRDGRYAAPRASLGGVGALLGATGRRLQAGNSVEQAPRAQIGDLVRFADIILHDRAGVAGLDVHRLSEARRLGHRLAHLDILIEPAPAEFEHLGADRHPAFDELVAQPDERIEIRQLAGHSKAPLLRVAAALVG